MPICGITVTNREFFLIFGVFSLVGYTSQYFFNKFEIVEIVVIGLTVFFSHRVAKFHWLCIVQRAYRVGYGTSS